MRETDVFPSKYLTGLEIEDHEVAVVIEKVIREEVGTDKDSRPVAYFQGHTKGVVLNKTNWRNLAYAYGDESDDWFGKKAILYTIIAHNPRTGEDGPSIRIKTPTAARKQKAKPAPAESENPAEGMTTGEYINDEIPF